MPEAENRSEILLVWTNKAVIALWIRGPGGLRSQMEQTFLEIDLDDDLAVFDRYPMPKE